MVAEAELASKCEELEVGTRSDVGFMVWPHAAPAEYQVSQASLVQNNKLKQETMAMKAEIVSKKEQVQKESTQKLRIHALEQQFNEAQALMVCDAFQ